MQQENDSLFTRLSAQKATTSTDAEEGTQRHCHFMERRTVAVLHSSFIRGLVLVTLPEGPDTSLSVLTPC
jgi:hypothetical protein